MSECVWFCFAYCYVMRDARTFCFNFLQSIFLRSTDVLIPYLVSSNIGNVLFNQSDHTIQD